MKAELAVIGVATGILVLVVWYLLSRDANAVARFPRNVPSGAPAQGVVRDFHLVLRLPDGACYSFATDHPRFLKPGGSAHRVRLSENQLAALMEVFTAQPGLKWLPDVAILPYPPDETALLWYGPRHQDCVRCTLGAPESALPILERMLTVLPESARGDFEDTLEVMQRLAHRPALGSTATKDVTP